MSEWSDMSIWGLLFGWLWVRILCLSGVTCLSGDCCLVGSVRILCLSGVTCQDIMSEWRDCCLVGSGSGSGYCV